MFLTPEQKSKAQMMIDKLEKLNCPSFLELSVPKREKELTRKSIIAEIALALQGKKVNIILNEYIGSADCVNQKELDMVLEDCIKEGEDFLEWVKESSIKEDSRVVSHCQ